VVDPGLGVELGPAGIQAWQEPGPGGTQAQQWARAQRRPGPSGEPEPGGGPVAGGAGPGGGPGPRDACYLCVLFWPRTKPFPNH